jgi:flagellar hook-length control protein FliK
MSAQQSGLAIDKLQDFDPQLRIQDVKINPDKITDQFFVEGQEPAALQMKNMLKGQTNEKDKDELKDELKNKLGEHNPTLNPQDLKLDNQFSQNLNTKLEGTLAAQVPTEARNENINKITEHAQTLITKGGGEMKIQLRPEGMGDVLLKVKVQDGQVGIQMTTDSHEAKKLLETGMNDLKLNLAEHKLSLNHMKVDVAAQNDSNTNTNNSNNQERRDEAREFLSQFRDYNQSMRQQFAGTDGVKAYMKSGVPRAPEVTTSSSSAKSRSSSSNPDGRLYLVA